MSEENVIIVTQEDQLETPIKKSHAQCSMLLKGLIEDQADDEPIPLPGYDKPTFDRVKVFLEHHN